MILTRVVLSEFRAKYATGKVCIGKIVIEHHYCTVRVDGTKVLQQNPYTVRSTSS